MKEDTKQRIAIALSLFGIALVILLDEPFIVEFDLNQIDTINGESKFLHTEKGKLINNYRSGVVFPSDKITYKTDVIGDVNENILIKPIITVVQAGKNSTEPVTVGDINLNRNGHLQKISKEFFIGDEGRTEIHVDYFVFNTTSQKQIDVIPLQVEIEVLSLSDKLQSDQNTTLLIGIMVSGLIGFITFLALRSSQKTAKEEIVHLKTQNEISNKQNEISNKHTKFLKNQTDLLKKQNEDLKEQTSIQDRPWISVADTEVKYELKSDMLKIFVRNYGKTPAMEVTATVMSSLDPIDLLTLENLTPQGTPTALAPNEIMSFRFRLTSEMFKAGHGGKGFNFGLKVTYTFENSKIGKFLLTGIIDELSGSGMSYATKKLE